MKRFLSFLLLPLSVVPFIAIAPTIVQSRERFTRQHQMGPLPLPAAGLTAAEAVRYTPFPAPAGKVPVLVWHGIGPARDGYSVSQAEFARQLELLKRLGYTSISTRQWADFRTGRTAGLPDKPILLTFDDGRLDSYRGADRVLQRAGMRAAMFVITQEIAKGNPFYLSWEELHKMRDSGRWDIEPHAQAGHQELAISADGKHAPYYAARRYTRSQGMESLAGWEARVSEDLFTLRQRFADQGIEPHAFAVPYGDYGQRGGNDPAIPGLLSGLLTRQFGNWFVQADDNDPEFTVPGTGSAQRYELRTGSGIDSLDRWLRRHSTENKR
jgi:peptidoglycan/xylan/chitin deacetylase (PgdA/CDA1 family)